MEILTADICVIGGGSGGLSVAAGASQMGAKVILCEGGKMGGDCLNYGCVPSKALIEASRNIHDLRKSAKFGIHANQLEINFSQIHQHIQKVIETIEPHDSIERFESLGVKVIPNYASFIDQKTIQAGSYRIKAKYIVIATGSSAFIPPIKGLSDVPFLTNESIFDLTEKPEHLAVIGGGPIGCEIAQSYALLGTKVTLLESTKHILAPVEKECREVAISAMKAAGIEIKTNLTIDEIAINSDNDQALNIYYQQDDSEQLLTASHLLIATGRTANLHKLNLDNAKIKYHAKGVNVNAKLQTNQKRIYAIGDIASAFQFTHMAAYHAGIVIQNILFKLPAKVNYNSFPWAIYTTPEIAHVGISFDKAIQMGATILSFPYKDNDRAVASLETRGLIKVAVNKKGYVYCACIVGKDAADLITPWTMMIANKLRIKTMASLIIPYPTLSEINKRIAGSYFTPILYGNKTRKLVQFLLKWF